jgi:acyl-coenzyme A thioesterase PaaI-like protein
VSERPAGVAPETVHPGCILCGRENERGLRLRFGPDGIGDGHGVVAALECEPSLEGYPGRLHGGVIAAALDAAMTHCLLALGRTAVTAELTIRFRHPVLTGRPATVRAWLQRDMAPLYLIGAELVQDDLTKAVATGKFMEEDA